MSLCPVKYVLTFQSEYATKVIRILPLSASCTALSGNINLVVIIIKLHYQTQTKTHQKYLMVAQEFLKRVDTQTHVHTEISKICAKFLHLNEELAKQALFIFLAQFDIFFLKYFMFYSKFQQKNLRNILLSLILTAPKKSLLECLGSPTLFY